MALLNMISLKKEKNFENHLQHDRTIKIQFLCLYHIALQEDH